jgi:endo-1,4-beta-D-glucanase Y
MRRRIALVLIASLIAASCAAKGSGASGPIASSPVSATAAARVFLTRYVDSNGRVVRHDQGGDSVSEGQAYAMLLDVAVDDRAQFDRVWSWSRSELLQPDGLLAWDWSDGKVVSKNPASDADLDIAKALVLAGKKWHNAVDARQGIRYAEAILANETVSAGGKLWLLAGNWARTGTHYLDPSYLDPGTFELLYRATHDARWKQIEASSAAAIDADTAGGTQLPSDWAQVLADGQVQPSAPPGGGAVVYGYDAFRTLIRQYDGCTTGTYAGLRASAVEGRQLDAKLFDVATRTTASNDEADTYNTNGTVAQSGDNPLMLIAAAGTAKAAGRTTLTTQYLRQAAAAEAQDGSYYLDAWVALGMLLLTTDRLSPCVT